MRQKSAIIIGAGINGLVAANVLARAGWKVTQLERKAKPGGACVSETCEIDGEAVAYPLGATVLGMMQDFVLRETGLAKRVALWAPHHPKVVRFPSVDGPVLIWRDARRLQQELRDKLGERGSIDAFRADEDKVIAFLQDGYRRGQPPNLQAARDALGADQARLWIEGSARALMDHYFTDERTKCYMGMTAIESGPVPFDAPTSAFSVPLMDSGSVFDGYWGFVKGGIWRITEELARINAELGVELHCNAQVSEADAKLGTVWWHDGSNYFQHAADHLVFATDPVTAASALGTGMGDVIGKKFRGSSGKVVMIFRKPIRWKDDTGDPEHDAAFKFIFARDTLDSLDAASQATAVGADYAPGYYQVYCEGAASRMMGESPKVDRIVTFFKNLGLGRTGATADDVREDVVRRVLATVENPEDLAWTRLLMPADLRETFFFPEGNIDHAMLTEGQQYHARTYSTQPAAAFYRFGSAERVWYCGAGAYPCGSVAGTTGWMCSHELLRASGA